MTEDTPGASRPTLSLGACGVNRISTSPLIGNYPAGVALTEFTTNTPSFNLGMCLYPALTRPRWKKARVSIASFRRSSGVWNVWTSSPLTDDTLDHGPILWLATGKRASGRRGEADE